MNSPVARPRLRVAIVSNSFQPDRGALSGSFIHTLEVARRWRAFDVVVVAPEEARRSINNALPNATFVAARPRRMPRWLRGLPTLSNIARLCGTVAVRGELRRCDIVLSMTTFLADVLPMLMIPRRSAAVAIQHLQTPPWRRNGPLPENARAWITECLGLAVVRFRASLIFANDDKLARRLVGPRSDAVIRRLRHGVDHLRGDVRPHDEPGQPLVVYVGRLHPTKGLEDLLKAWPLIVSVVPDARLRLVGAGDDVYTRRLEELSQRLGITPSVAFLGALAEADKCAVIQKSRVFAFPSHEEGWGIALAEAMTLGVPCVTYNLAAYRNVFTSGRLEVPLFNIAAFGDAVVRLLTDDQLHHEMSTAAIRLAESFTWQRAADVYAEAFLAAAHPRQARGE